MKNENAEQPAPKVVDCHATGVCVQSGLRAEQPAQQEPVAWMTQARNFVHLTEFTEAEAKLYGWKAVCTFPQPAQHEPVAKYIGEGSEGSLVQLYDDVKKGADFYTSPPTQRTWQGLTDADWEEISDMPDSFDQGVVWAVRKLKEKNT